jgi:hypothetical protein
MKTARDNGQVLGATSSFDAYDNVDTHDFKPMTAEEVQKLRLQQPLLSIWRVVLAQMLVGLAVAVLTWLFTGQFQQHGQQLTGGWRWWSQQRYSRGV